MENFYSEAQLRNWAELYWSKAEETALAYYLGPIDGVEDAPPKPLLHIEMEYTANRDRLPARDERSVTLAILVGESFDPLLQTIWAFQPNRLVAVVNKYYGDRDSTLRNHIPGNDQWRKLRAQIQRLPDERRQQIGTLPRKVDLVMDTPSAVFDFLHENLREDLSVPERRVVIDITGAKKTMVAGAFLLAAYTNAEITYVDFDSYHPKKGRPYGHSCWIRSVDNPFRDMGLREWERAAQLYEQFDFVGALAVLPRQLPDAARSWQPSLEALRRFLRLCGYWENGQLHEAQELVKELPSNLCKHVPLAVRALGKHWPEPGSQRLEWLSEEFLTDPRLIRIFALDELKRCIRLLSQKSEMRRDYRGAFMRAYALHETLLKARVAGTFHRGCFRITRANIQEDFDSNHIPDDLRIPAQHWLYYWLSSGDAKRLMTMESGGEPFGTTWHQKEEKQKVKVRFQKKVQGSGSSSPPKLPNELLTEYPVDLREKRNVIIHSYVPGSKLDVLAAIQLAKANFDDYSRQWGSWLDNDFDPDVSLNDSNFQLPDWKILKNHCGLEFIPDPRPKVQEGTQ